MTSWWAEDTAGTSEVFQLLEEYCNKRSKQGSPRMFPEVSFKKFTSCCGKGASSGETSTHDEEDNRMFSASGTTPEAEMDDIIQRLVELIKAEGDDIDRKLKQNLDLQQQLRDLNYDMFKKLTSSVQSLVSLADRVAVSGVQIQRQKIALAFEVTSRLSAMSVVHRRRMVLSFGEQYIQENHSAWVEQHGGWAEAFSID